MKRNEDGSIMIGSAIDTKGFDEGKTRIVNGIEDIGATAEREGAKMEAQFRKIGVATAAYFSFNALKEFASNVVRVRGEIEALEISFETLLGSKDKADALFSSIRDFAVSTPMTMNALASGAQTLLGFGIEADKVMPILQQIGDISMGDANKFNSLTLAFAQASSAGKLAGQDFLQMVNAGFNPLNEMAKTTGKSIKQLKEEMENGQITTAKLEAAFASATAEGGMFYGMLEKQSQGIKGALSNLQGAWDEMLNNIGEKQQSVFVGGVNSLTSLIQNYEVFLNAILSVAAAYGTYEAALMGVWVIEKARALADNVRLVMMFRKELGLLTAAQQAFNVTAWANPYVLLAAAIVGVCAALYLYSDRTSDAEQGQKALNDERDRFENSLKSERDTIEDCIRVIQDKTQTDFNQIKAYEQLKKICPEITNAYTREELAVAKLSDTAKILNERQENQTYQHAIDELAKWEKALDDVKNAGSNWSKLPKESDAIVRTVHSWGLLKNAIPKMEEVIKGYRSEVDEIKSLRKKVEEESKPLNVRIKTQTEIVSDLQAKLDEAKQELDAAQKAYEDEPTLWNKNIEIRVRMVYTNLKEQLENANQTLQNLQDQQPTTYASAYSKAQKEYKEAKAAIDKMKRNRSAYTQTEYTEAAETLKDAKKAFESLGGEIKSDSTIKSEAKKIKEALDEIKQIRRDNQLKIDEAQLKVFEDGKTKRLKAIELERQQTIAAIDKEQSELAKKMAEAKTKLSASDLAGFNARRTAANEYAAAQVKKTEEENTLYIAELYRNLSDVFDTEEKRKVNSIKNTYAESRRQLKKDLESGNITQEQYNDLLEKNSKADAKEIENAWLETYGDYYQKRKALQDKWEANLAVMPSQYQANARKMMKQELSQLDSDNFKSIINWDAVFGDMGKQSIDTLQYNLDKIKQYFEANKASMDAKEIKDYQEAITKMEDEIASRNPFAAFHKSLKDITSAKTEFTTAMQEWKTAQDALKAAQDEYNAALEHEKEVQAMGADGEPDKETEEYKAAVERLTQAKNALTNATQRNNNAEQKALTARNNVTNAYKNFATQLRNVNGVVQGLGGDVKNLADAFGSDMAKGIDKALDTIDAVMNAASNVIDAISDVGKGAAEGVEKTVDATAQGAEASAAAGAAAISMIEKASVILAVISAALQVATAIASLFNDDDAKQEEIENLQRRIDQLQWELDNQDAVRLQNRLGDAVERVRNVYIQTTAEVMRLHEVSKRYGNFWGGMIGQMIYENEMMERSINKIADAYAKAAYTADKALGNNKYADSRKQLENLAEQQLLIQKQINEERSKKDTDWGRIEDWQRDIQEIAEQMATIINEMLEDVIGASAEDLASQLGDAFIEAAAKGEDAMEAWHSKVKEIVADVMKRMLITKFLEEPLGEIFDKYKKKWFGEDGQFKGIDTVIDSMNGFSNDLNQVGEGFQKIWSTLPDTVKDWFTEDVERQGATKGIATASQESVDENNARLTTIQGHTYSLVQGMEELNRTTNTILERVTGIERNTSTTNDRLNNIDNKVKSIKDSVDDISLRGIKLR